MSPTITTGLRRSIFAAATRAQASTARHLATSAPSRPILRTVNPPHARNAGTYARFSNYVGENFYFRPATWIVLALTSAVAGAGTILYSTSDFISYSNAESLSIFSPIHPKQSEVDAHINAHPLTLSLRANPAFTESRPTLKIHEQYRNASLTSGALAGPGKIEVPPYVWSEDGGKSLVSIMYLGTELCGYPGLIHGGLLATLLDEGLAMCSFPALPNRIGMTANLTVNYRRPSPAESFVVLKAKTVKVQGRKAWVVGHLETLAAEGEEPVVLVEATALMIEPKQAGVCFSSTRGFYDDANQISGCRC